MELIPITDIIQTTKGILESGSKDILIKDISIDSRTINKDSLFLAVKGNRFDGHDFLEDAFRKGALGAVISKEANLLYKEKVIIKVPDTIKALGKIALYNRKRYSNILIAITGSNGKTTTKEMVASIIGKKFKVCKSSENYNNEIGIPLSLLKVLPSHEIIVVEMGMNSLGEIDNLAKISKPDIGVITNIGQTHLENLTSIENVFKGKIELLHNLTKEGIAVLNADDPFTEKIRKIFKGKIITIGIKNKADYKAILIKHEDVSCISFDIENKAKNVTIKRVGTHDVYNALVGFALGCLLKIDISLIKKGLLDTEYPTGRTEFISKKDIVIIDDTYNANPCSMKKAVDALTNISKAKRRIIVVGDMGELGKQAEELHREVGKYIAEKKKIDLLFTLGELGELIGEGAKNSDFPEENIFCYRDKDKLVKTIKKILRPYDYILVKGSRMMNMEKIVREIT
ncbi:MAG: UDP-N-acetylmuramoyl-tripeptide--D-alanyl-D-alanine ligase [bacterium]|nr:UDP-N-acetylmuramoyl-tripeptide--D-alanyl-D-alanine ligase [bacterium]